MDQPPPADAVDDGLPTDDIVWLEREYALLFGQGRLPPGLGPQPDAQQRVSAWRQAVHDLARRPPAQGRPGPTALCLSGGGIRSATFGLGVLQGLAANGWLRRFDYLSTVSGGGYIGCWLATWIAREQQPGVDGRDRVLQLLRGAATTWAPGRAGPAAAKGAQGPGGQGADQAAPEPDPLRRLRGYSNFLSPAVGLGGDLMALVAIFLRNLVVRWLVLVPLLCALLLLPRLYLAAMSAFQAVAGQPVLGLLDRHGAGVPLAALLFGLAVALVALATAYMAADLPELPPWREPATGHPPDWFWRLNAWPLLAASLLFSLTAPWLAQHMQPLHLGDWLAFGLFFGAMHLAAATAGMRWRLQRGLHGRVKGALSELPATFTVGALGGLLLLAALCWFGSLWPVQAQPVHSARSLGHREWFALLATPAMVGVFWCTVTLFAVLTRPGKTEFDREWWARAAGWWLVAALVWLGAGLLVLVLPRLALDLLDGGTGSTAAGSAAVTGGAAVLGVLSSIWGYWSRNGQKLVAGTKGLLETLNARALDLAAAAFALLLGLALALATSAVLEQLPAQAWPAAAATPQRQATHLADARRAAQRSAADCSRQAPAEQTLRIDGQVVAVLSQPAPAASQPERPGSCPRPRSSAAERYRAVLHSMPLGWLLGAGIGLALLGWGINWRAGTNVFSLHGLYGNRLIRAYLGASVPEPAGNPAAGPATPALERRPHRFTGFDEADNLPLCLLQNQRPFLVVNAALNLTQASGDRLEWQQRKAASFTFTPLACGSPKLGHAPTLHYGRKRPLDAAPGASGQAGGQPAAPAAEGSLSVGRAMAISGAAASPNMGYHSSPVVAFAMSFFNVRLGWWLPNPRLPGAAAQAPSPAALRRHWGRDEPAPGLATLWAETLGRSHEHSESVYLSDGGHFDNMGLYEMVRRRCHRIVLVDATADPGFRHEDLQSTLRKIRVDLGVEIEFALGVPGAESTRRTGRPWALARLRYSAIDPGAPDGSLLYIKPALWDGLPLDVQRYAERSRDRKGRRPPFPHQSTGDQFFDEAQFESYRLLGLLAAANALPDRHWPQGPGPDHRQGEASAAPAAGAAASGPAAGRA